MLGRPLEDHVLQEMRHAGFAVALVPRTDEYGHVHRHLWARVIGIEQETQAVCELVLGDALDGRDFLRRWWIIGLRKCGLNQRKAKEQNTGENDQTGHASHGMVLSQWLPAAREQRRPLPSKRSTSADGVPAAASDVICRE
jgi:hypothetical protein